MTKPMTFSEIDRFEINKWRLEAFGFKLLKLNYSNIFSVVTLRLLMTSLIAGPHLEGVV